MQDIYRITKTYRLYEILGVDKTATSEEIKRAYRKLARECHPDTHPDDTTLVEKFKELNMAYEVLGNPAARTAYDISGDAVNADSAPSYDDQFHDVYNGSMEDVINKAKKKQAQRKGEDLEVFLRASIFEAATGCSKYVEYIKEDACQQCLGLGAAEGEIPVVCYDCHGTGIVTHTIRRSGYPITKSAACHTCGGSGRIVRTPCQNCGGTGRTRQRAKVNVAVPAGIEDGQVLVLANAGNMGYNGGSYGNLRVTVRIIDHDTFAREGTTIRTTESVSFYQAAMGATIDVKTLTGTSKLRLHPGTQNGEEYIIEKAGIPDLETRIMGDHVVTIHVRVPTNMNSKQRELLKQWAVAMKENP